MRHRELVTDAQQHDRGFERDVIDKSAACTRDGRVIIQVRGIIQRPFEQRVSEYRYQRMSTVNEARTLRWRLVKIDAQCVGQALDSQSFTYGGRQVLREQFEVVVNWLQGRAELASSAANEACDVCFTAKNRSGLLPLRQYILWSQPTLGENGAILPGFSRALSHASSISFLAHQTGRALSARRLMLPCATARHSSAPE